MKDALGQEIHVGDKVAWLSGKGRYSGLDVYEIEKLTDKKVKFKPKGFFSDSRYIWPSDVLVINKLLEGRNNECKES